MATLRWTARDAVESPPEVVVMASRLPLARYRSVPAFLRATVAIRRQLAASEGLIGHSLKADLRRKTFHTLSAWTSESVLNDFAVAQPHLDYVAAIRPHMLPTTFVTWWTSREDIPVSWAEAQRRLDQA
jgi:hypothetical protein